MSAVVCSSCGGDMTIERVHLADGRQRMSLTCDECWDGIVEYTRREEVWARMGNEHVLIGRITVPAEAT